MVFCWFDLLPSRVQVQNQPIMSEIAKYIYHSILFTILGLAFISKGQSQAQFLVSYSEDCSTIESFHQIADDDNPVISNQGFYAYNPEEEIYYYVVFNPFASIIGVNVESGLVEQEVSLFDQSTGEDVSISRIIYSSRLGRLLAFSEGELILINPITGEIENTDGDDEIEGGVAQISYMERDSVLALTVGGGLERALYIVDDSTGEVLFDSDFDFIGDEDIQHHSYDQSTGRLYGVVRSAQVGTFNFVEINVENGSLTRIGNALSEIAFSGTSTIDEENQEYIYLGAFEGDWYIVKIDINTGQVVKNQMVQLTGDFDRVDDLVYDDVTETLYSKHWDPDFIVGGVEEEICDNGIDDDGDGAIDCNDSDLAMDCCCREALVVRVSDVTLCAGETLELVASSENYTGTYAWTFDGVPILNSIFSSLEVSEAGAYTVTIMDDCSTAIGTSVVSVLDAMTLNLPSTHTACEGELITLIPETEATSLTWFIDGNIIQGYNELTLDIEEPGVVRVVAGFGTACEQEAETIVTFNSITGEMETFYLCEGGTVMVNGFIYNGPGIFLNTDPGTGDCGGNSRFEIIEIPTVEINETFTVCENESVRVQGLNYFLPGNYFLRIPDQFGCDTVYNFTIVHLPVPTIEKTIYLSDGMAEFNGETYDTPGQYIQTLPSLGACDTSCVINVFQGDCLVAYDFDACNASVTLGNFDYSEFLPTYPQTLSCGNLVATEFHRENPMDNRHSCTVGLDDTAAICISSEPGCDFVIDSELAGRMRVEIDPEGGNEVLLTRLVFSQMAPATYNWSHTSGPNNYPTQFGIRILVDGIAVFQRTDMNTTLTWSEVAFNLDEDAIVISARSVVEVEILGYCLIGNGAQVSAFDLENIKIFGGCQSTTATRMLAGQVSLGLVETIENVEVKSFSRDFSRTRITDDTGQYAFGQSEAGLPYVLTAHKDDNHLAGVSTLDLIAIQRHILGIEPLVDPLQQIAADINDDKVINGIDLVELRKLILGIYESLPENESYRFFDRNSVLASKDVVALNDRLVVQADEAHRLNLNFVGAKVGDVLSNQLTYRNNQSITLFVDDKTLVAGEKVIIPVYASEISDLIGLQTTFGFDPEVLQFSDLRSGAITVSDAQLSLANKASGFVSWSWVDLGQAAIAEGRALVELEFDVVSSGTLSQSLSLPDTTLKSEAYNASLETLPLHLDVRSSDDQSGFIMYPSSPNPFKNKTAVSFNLPTATEVHYSIFSANGELVLDNTVEFDRGLNTIVLDSYNMNVSGVLYLKLETRYGSATQKMVLIK